MILRGALYWRYSAPHFSDPDLASAGASTIDLQLVDTYGISGMMCLSQLPDEVLLTLGQQWPCRDLQLRQLYAVLSVSRPPPTDRLKLFHYNNQHADRRQPMLPSPSTVVVFGPQATGKSGVVQAYLKSSKLRHAIVQCRECVTGRHLLERTTTAVHETLKGDRHAKNPPGEHPGRTENVSALAVHLQRLLRENSFVLVFDGIDKLREAPPTLLPALGRLGEMIPKLTIVLIVRHPSPRHLHQVGVPHVHFTPYSRAQSLHIFSRNPPDIFLEPPPEELEYDNEVHDEDKAWLWPRFCAAVWDSLAQNAARDLLSFRNVCNKLWRPFVAPIIKGDFGTRDFSRLLVAQRRLFQDESVLLDFIVPTLADPAVAKSHGRELPYYAKWMLVAAYLASFNPVKLDALYFMKATERKRRKKGGGTARSGGNKPGQTRKIPRHLLAASAFTIDRLLSILHAILPHELRTTIDIYTQIATLTSVRLLARSGGIGSSDPLEPGGKWRVGQAVSWEYVLALARSLDFDLLDYVAE